MAESEYELESQEPPDHFDDFDWDDTVLLNNVGQSWSVIFLMMTILL